MKILTMVLSLAVVFLMVSVAALGSASTQTQSFEVPLALSVFIPCANQGNGEVVDFSGTLHIVISSTVNGNNVHLNELVNPQGVKGVGETTGDVWSGTGVTRMDLTSSVSAFPFEATFVSNFNLVDGKGGSFFSHENAHVTVNADGTLTVNLDNLRFSCK